MVDFAKAAAELLHEARACSEGGHIDLAMMALMGAQVSATLSVQRTLAEIENSIRHLDRA